MSPGRRLDLHVHSSHSPDGRSDVDQLVAGLASRGLDGFALTDHNSVAGHRRLAELARERPELRLVPGVEVSTREGHLLLLGVSEAPPARRPIDETIEWARAHGGVPVPSHPFRRVHGVGGEIASRAKVPALEVLNGHNGSRTNARAAAIAAQRGLGATGGSDAHHADELGRAWTAFADGSDSVAELLEQLGRGTTTSGGRSATAGERSRLALRSLALRLGRGLRPI